MVPASRSSVAVTEAAHAVFFTAGKMSRVADSPIIVAEMAMLDDMRRDKVLLRAKACGVGAEKRGLLTCTRLIQPYIHISFL